MGRWSIVIAMAVTCAGGVWQTAGAEAPRTEAGGQQAGDGYAEAARLRREQVILREALRDLDREVQRLTRDLAEARAELDLLRVRGAGRDEAGPITDGRLDAGALAWMRVIAVDREHGVLAVTGGAEQNLRVGMTGVIVRNNRVMATVRLDEVRPRVSGAVILQQPAGRAPQPGDRLVFGTTTDE